MTLAVDRYTAVVASLNRRVISICVMSMIVVSTGKIIPKATCDPGYHVILGGGGGLHVILKVYPGYPEFVFYLSSPERYN